MEHIPVLLKECIDGLNIKPEGIYVDGTLGRAGHSKEIVKRLTTGKLIAIDRDMKAIEEARENLKEYKDKIIYVHSNFSRIGEILDDLSIDKVDGMLFDLGVSSPQLDDASRGFSYMSDGPLDMRMDESSPLTACDIVNGWSEGELKRILFDYGEERYAPRIARAIVKKREEKKIESTLELVEIIKSALPAQALREKQHPAKRTFQAIRIAVNEELTSISKLLDTAMDRLNEGGRIAVISFHSLEDRIVKSAIASKEKGCTCPPEFPVCTCGFVQTMRSVNRKPILPTKEELERNPRSRSAKLRIAERI